MRNVVLSACGLLAVIGTVCALLPGEEQTRPLRRNICAGLAVDFIGELMATSDLDAGLLGNAGKSAPRGPTSLVASGQGAKNLVFIILESTGARHTGVHGSPHATTPYLEELAPRGAVVERAYTVFPHTSKALIGIHCGVHPRPISGVPEAAANGMPVSCLPRLLREQGMATAFFQTAEENYERRSSLTEEFGFEDFTGKESIHAEDFEESNYFGWEDDAMFAPILEWVDAQTGRFYLSILTLTAHHPYAVPRNFPTENYVANKPLNDYLNTLRYSDRFVQRLYEAFEERGLAKDTVFVITGDHGEAFGEHGRSQHTPVPYDEALHVPLILVGPGVAPGTRVQGLRQSIDLMPTVTRLLGFEPRGGSFYGRDLLRDDPHDELFFHCGYHEYCMGFLWPDYKLIHHFERQRPEVFDLRVDPMEKNDLYKNPTATLKNRIEPAIARLRNVRTVTNAAYLRQAKRRVPRFVHTSMPDKVEANMDVRLGGFARVVRFTVEPATIEAGGRTVLTTWYEVMEDPPGGWRPFHHLVGTSYKNADHVPVEGSYPVQKWEKGDIIEDRHVLTTRPDAETGRWEITTGMWRKLPDGGSERAKAEVRNGQATVSTDNKVVVGTLDITASRLDPTQYVSRTPPALGETTVDIRFGDDLGLVQAGVKRPDTKGGLRVTQEYVWKVWNPPADGTYEFVVEVVGRTKEKRFVHEPLGGTLPVSRWEEGQFIRDPQGIITKTSDALGTYQIWLHIRRDGETLPVQGKGLSHDGQRVLVGEFRLVR